MACDIAVTRSAILAIAVLTLAPARLDALVTPVGRSDIERALALARWPKTDADRAQFHARYIARLAPSPAAGVAVESIEVITEFRRMELIAEAHAQLNDLFARGGAIQEAEQALQPWRGRVSIVAHVRLGAVSAGLPEVAVLFERPAGPRPLSQTPTPTYSEGAITGVDAESTFAAAAVGQTRRNVVVFVGGRPLAGAVFDFRRLD